MVGKICVTVRYSFNALYIWFHVFLLSFQGIGNNHNVLFSSHSHGISPHLAFIYDFRCSSKYSLGFDLRQKWICTQVGEILWWMGNFVNQVKSENYNENKITVSWKRGKWKHFFVSVKIVLYGCANVFISLNFLLAVCIILWQFMWARRGNIADN